jgi:hypothetical protein
MKCYMKIILASAIVGFFAIQGPYAAGTLLQNGDNSSDASDWIIGCSVLYSPRTIAGSIQYDKNGPNDYLATTDSLGLDTANSFMYQAGAKHKRWTFGVNYAPVEFSGTGYAYDLISQGGGGIAGKVRVNTTVNVDLLLGNVLYDLVREKNMKFSVGGGLGASMIDIAITPPISTERGLKFDDTTPFGFFTVNMLNNYQKFIYGMNLNSIGFGTEGFDLSYSDFTLNLGYNILLKPFLLNIMGGYRQVNFKMEMSSEGTVVEPNIQVTGPFLGLNALF